MKCEELICQQNELELRKRFSVLDGLKLVDESGIGHEKKAIDLQLKKWSSKVKEAGEKILGFKRGVLWTEG